MRDCVVRKWTMFVVRIANLDKAQGESGRGLLRVEIMCILRWCVARRARRADAYSLSGQYEYSHHLQCRLCWALGCWKESIADSGLTSAGMRRERAERVAMEGLRVRFEGRKECSSMRGCHKSNTRRPVRSRRLKIKLSGKIFRYSGCGLEWVY